MIRNFCRFMAFIMLAALFLTGGSGLAQWYTDPDHATCGITSGVGDLRICSDGLNGAFFSAAFSEGISSPHYIGHVNASGRLSYGGAIIPYLLPIDSAHRNIPAMTSMVPSYPNGTAITTSFLVAYDTTHELYYVGLSFAQFDSAGMTGFHQIDVIDSTYTLHSRAEVYYDHASRHDCYSDGQGGIHIILDANYGGTYRPGYYNHLTAAGQWTHVWPGILLNGNMDGQVYRIIEDGAGGVVAFTKWNSNAPQFPDQFTFQHFDSAGHPYFAEPRPVPRPDLNYLMLATLLSPGRILIYKDSVGLANVLYHYLFLLDTSGINLWEPQGRPFLREAHTRYFVPRSDLIGGFFFDAFDLDDSLWTSYHYNGNGNIIGQTPAHSANSMMPSPENADGMGGVYYVKWTTSPLILPQDISVWRWESDFQFSWPDSVLAYRQPNPQLGVVRWIVSDDHAIIGAAPAEPGLVIFRVDPDGHLGPSASVPFSHALEPADFRIAAVYPNPFNGPLRVQFQVERPQMLELVVYDVLGRIAERIPARWAEAGEHEWMWNPEGLASGTYYISLKTEGQERVRAVRAVYVK
jgi:hypothetical protein